MVERGAGRCEEEGGVGNHYGITKFSKLTEFQKMYAPPPRLNLVVLRSSDIDRAAKFYSAMGLLFTRHSHGNGPEHYTSEVDGSVFEIYPATEKSKPTIGTRIGFAVDSVDQLIPPLVDSGPKYSQLPAIPSGAGARFERLGWSHVELVTAILKIGQAGG